MSTVEPAFMLLLYAFALWGAFLAPRRFCFTALVSGSVLSANNPAAVVKPTGSNVCPSKPALRNRWRT
jgi:hypothetical protein